MTTSKRRGTIREHNISYPKLAVCEERPVIASLNTHRSASNEPVFDMHYALEMGIVLSGSVTRYCQDHQRLCRTGDAWFCGMWDLHAFRIETAPCKLLVMVIWPTLLINSFFPEAPGIPWMKPFKTPARARPAADSNERKELMEIAARVALRASDDSPPARLRLRMLALEMLMCILRDAKDQESVPHSIDPAGHRNILPVLDMVFDSSAMISNASAAGTCGMSPDGFARAFKNRMGISFAQFALRHRIQRAANELAVTDKPVKAIAADWGFVDESHFYKLFRKHYGRTPLEYRRLARQEVTG